MSLVFKTEVNGVNCMYVCMYVVDMWVELSCSSPVTCKFVGWFLRGNKRAMFRVLPKSPQKEKFLKNRIQKDRDL